MNKQLWKLYTALFPLEQKENKINQMDLEKHHLSMILL